jgi:uncharacterized protein YkwD
VPRTRTVVAGTAALVLLALPATASAEQTGSEGAESRMVSAINHVRAQRGLSAFGRSSSLTGSAERYSRWLMANGVFAHQSRIQASDRFALLGEALAWHSGHRFEVRKTVRQWLGSAPHRAILLSPLMRLQGAGVTRGRFGRRAATIWVLHVGRLTQAGVQLPNVGLR